MDDVSRQYISDSIRTVPDFPKKGIMFHDVTTLLLDPKAFQLSVDDFAARYKDKKIDIVAGFEARGFIFGAPLALQLKCAFVPLRKPGKLPGETIGASYKLEYGEDRIEMHAGAITEGQRVLLLDDLIATGGTLAAGIKLMKQVKAEIVECACVIELPDLKGAKKLDGLPLYVQVQKEGD
ncbi:g9463 [Coccomyxa elongata]